MKAWIAAVLIASLICGPAWGATYYVAQSAAGAGNGTNEANAYAIATFNAGSAPFNDLDGDTVYFCGAITTVLQVPDGGADASNRVTLRGDCGTPANLSGAITRPLYNNAKDYVDYRNFIISNGTSQNAYVLNSTGVRLYDMTFSGAPTAIYFNASPSSVLSGWTGTATGAAGYVIRADGATTTITVSGGTSTNTTGFGEYFNGIAAATSTGNTYTNTQYAGTLIVGANDQQITIGNTYSGCGAAGSGSNATIQYNGNSATGLVLTMAATISGAVGSGVYIYNGDFNAASSMDGTAISGGAANGFYFSNIDALPLDGVSSSTNGSDGAYLVTYTNGIVESSSFANNGRDGLSLDTDSTNTIIRYNRATGNGTTDAVGNGDGITAHAGCTGLLIHHNVLDNNKNSGIGMVTTSAGSAYNNTIVKNGCAAGGAGCVNMGVRGGFYHSGAGAWTLGNNLLSENVPAEIAGDSDGLGAITSDYNLFYHPADTVYARNPGTPTNYTWAEWKSTFSQDAHSPSPASPLFVSTSNFHLLPQSPARGTGTNLCATLTTATDYAGRPVCSGGSLVTPNGKVDIGAYASQGFHFIKSGTTWFPRYVP